MGAFEIRGGNSLSGSIIAQGAKNEALQVLCAALLTDEPVTYTNVPDILDVNTLIELLEDMNVKVSRPEPNTVVLQAVDINVDYFTDKTFKKKSGKLRGAVMLAGPMLARFRKANIPQPGGDKIGRRRLDTHIRGFEKLGVKFIYDTEESMFSLDGSAMQGANMMMEEPSVTSMILKRSGVKPGHGWSYTVSIDPSMNFWMR